MASLTPRLDRLDQNYIINGDMRIAQRGTSFASIADSTYNLDRYTYFKTGAMVHTLTQDTDVPTFLQSNYLFQNSLRLNLTTPDTSIATGDRVEISQIMEGYNFANLAQRSFTLSFWVKATLTGTYCVYFRNSGADRSYIAEYTINATNTWEKKVIHVSASPTAGTWDYGNGIGLRIGWTLAAGSTFQTSAGAWQTGNYLATANQVNGVNTGATDFRITGISVNAGELESPDFSLFGKSFNGELIACQRYYEKSYNLNVVPGTVTDIGRWFEITSAGVGSATIASNYRVLKRSAGTVTTYNPITGASNNVRVSASNNAFTLSTNGETGFSGTVSAGADTGITWHYTADAEL